MADGEEMNGTTVEVIRPQPPPIEVKVTATLSIRDAAILLRILGATNGYSLTNLWGALSRNSFVAAEAAKLEPYGPTIDIRPWEDHA